MSDPIREQDAIRIRKQQIQTDTPQADVPAPHVPPVVALQSVVGNRAMRRMVIQPKMTVTAANDAYESEADSVASQVVQNIQATPVQRAGGEEEPLQAKRDVVQREGAEEEEPIQAKRDVVQREGAEEEEPIQAKRDVVQREGAEEEEQLQAKRDVVQREGAEEEEQLQAKRDVVQREGAEEEEQLQAKRDVVQRTGDMSGSFEVDDKVEGAIQGQLGGGQAMPASVRGKMESGFGADFSNVRVHTDQTSDTLNRSVGAKAFTQGSDIFFKSGAFQPESSDGQQLLAHELTHTIQQGAAVQQKRDQES